MNTLHQPYPVVALLPLDMKVRLRVRRNPEGIFVHYHCRFSPAEAIETVHEIIDRLEMQLQQAKPEIRRVIAHAEPVGYAQH